MKYFKAILESLLYFFIVILSQRIASFGYSLVLLKLAEKKGALNENVLQSIQQTQTIPIIMGWVLAFGLIGIVFLRIKQKPLKNLNSSLGALNFLLAIVIGLGLVLLTDGIVNALSIYYFIEPFFDSFSFVRGGPFIGSILLIGLMIPVFEELIFRGFIMGKLLNSGSKGFAILFQALLFSISHFNFYQGASVLLLGMVTGFSVMKTKSVKIGIVIHGIFNLTNLYLYQMDHEFYNVGQLTVFIILGVLLIYFGLDKLRRKKLKRSIKG